ncbi:MULTISPECIES: gamma subclass chorismate mutase AroQ [unclassified Pseudomonas]|uniref:gamma subclass chorismate mutase AroQ n=1 Tax=unclassified Pseudomonas TaxID=196821 RepID=UPI00117A1C41|nr:MULTISPECIES: gamma subclass chorismate mutase AroQ [unclassified Pseudomonas]
MRKLLPAMITVSALLAGCASNGTAPGQATSQVLHRATGSWDGTPYRNYPEGRPVLSLVKVSIPAHTTLGWHCHQALNLGYLAEGRLEVETRDGKRTSLVAGQTLAELQGEVHRGHTTGQPATVMVFHASNEDLAFSTPEAECPPLDATSEDAFDNLINAIEKRLATAESIALHKWDNDQPVQDTEREQQVQARVRNSAWRHQLPAERATRFFADQIEAHKMVQYALLERWQRRGAAPDAHRRDLTSELRPELDRLQAELLHSLSAFDKERRADCARQLATKLHKRPQPIALKQAMIRASSKLCDKT